MSNCQVSGQETLNYRLRPNSKGVRLDIWENSADVTSGQAPYRFFVTYQLKSADEAQTILDSYLIANDVYQTAASNDAAPLPHLTTLAGSESFAG